MSAIVKICNFSTQSKEPRTLQFPFFLSHTNELTDYFNHISESRCSRLAGKFSVASSTLYATAGKMSQKTYREGDSPSATSSLLPQIRNSRRGSTSSLSSIHVLGKETIAQALDQIHSSASQSESLTTFNEYTSPPSSSSGQEGKGITGELQGGISGLYNRFRASVSNVRDVVGSDTLEAVAEKTALEASRTPTPASTASYNGSRGLKNSSDTNSQQSTSIPAAGQVDNGPTIERVAALRPPQAQNGHGVLSPHKDRSASSDSSQAGGNQRKLSRTNELQIADVIRLDSVGIRPEDSNDGGDQDRSHKVSHEYRIEPARSMQVDESLKNPIMIDGEKDEAVVRQDVRSKDVPDGQHHPTDKAEKDMKYQHLEIPLRKSLAPPIVSRSASPGPELSRTSSLETNAESVLVMPTQATSSSKLNKDAEKAKSIPIPLSKEPGPSDARVMSVFSQAKSKVLSKEYWMKDENAKDCFGCGDAFSTFRRKHHCRKRDGLSDENHKLTRGL